MHFVCKNKELVLCDTYIYIVRHISLYINNTYIDGEKWFHIDVGHSLETKCSFWVYKKDTFPEEL